MIKKNSKWPYLLVAPAVLIVICVVFVPVVNAISMSLQHNDLRMPKQIAYIGLDNYKEVLKDHQFWLGVRNTALWVFFGVGFQFLFGFALALLLNQHFKGRGVIRAVSLIPWVTPGVLIGLMWRWMYDGNYGVITDILMRLKIIDAPIAVLAQIRTSLPSVIVTIVWQGIPFFALMILAGLQGIPMEMYEAADIDGASGIKKLFFVTIPSIKNTIFITLLLRIIWVANSVDVIFNMTGGGPAYSTQTLSVYIFNKAHSLNLGYSSAMAVILCLILACIAVPYMIMKFRHEEK